MALDINQKKANPTGVLLQPQPSLKLPGISKGGNLSPTQPYFTDANGVQQPGLGGFGQSPISDRMQFIINEGNLGKPQPGVQQPNFQYSLQSSSLPTTPGQLGSAVHNFANLTNPLNAGNASAMSAAPLNYSPVPPPTQALGQVPAGLMPPTLGQIGSMVNAFVAGSNPVNAGSNQSNSTYPPLNYSPAPPGTAGSNQVIVPSAPASGSGGGTGTPTPLPTTTSGGAGEGVSTVGAGGNYGFQPTGPAIPSTSNNFGSGVDTSGPYKDIPYTLDAAGKKVYSRLSDAELASLKGLTTSTNDPIDSTTGLRQSETDANNKQAAELAQRAVDLSNGIYNTADQQRIDDAGKAVEGQFNAMIEESKQARTTGMGSAMIGAGQHGGLMNSQFAGAAALPGNRVAPTPGSYLPGATSGFIGAGGQFEKIQSAYDSTINKLNMQKESAIAAAKAAMREAISTGNSKALEDVQKVIKYAQDTYKAGIDAANTEADTAAKVFKTQSDKMQASAANMIPTDEDGNVTKLPTDAEIYKAAVAGGYDPEQFKASVREHYQSMTKENLGNLKTVSDIQDKSATSHSPIYTEYQDAKSQGYTGTFDQYQTEDANRKKQAMAASGLSPSTQNAVIGINRNFESNQIVKNFNDISSSYTTAKQIIENGTSGPGDVAMIFSFMKALDPGSVVKEGEYAKGEKSGNIFAGTFEKFRGYFKSTGGSLPPALKEEFKRVVETKYNAQKKAYENYRNEKINEINRVTGDSDGSNWITSFDYEGSNQQEGSSGNSDGDSIWDN